MTANTRRNEYQPTFVTHPGETLVEALEEHGMSQADLARRIGLSRKAVNQIARGKVPITTDTALRLEKVLQVPARFWLRRQLQFEEAQKRIERRLELTKYLDWLKLFPYREMTKLGWLEEGDDRVNQLDRLLTFFAVATPNEWTGVWEYAQAAFRTSASYEPDPYALSAWLRKGDLEAKLIRCQPFDSRGFKDALSEARELTGSTPEVFVPRLVDLCAISGVAVVFVCQLKKTRANGATKWLTPEKAKIQLSLRGRYSDILWFTFFHEAGHILLHGKRSAFVDVPDGLKTLEETQADRFGGDLLIPPQSYSRFVDRRPFTKSRVLAFAEELGIGPGIVVGRLQHDKHVHWNSTLNDLKMRLRWLGNSD